MPIMSWGGLRRRRGVVLLAGAVLAFAVVSVPLAAAQAPAGVDQYQPLPPGGDEGPISGGGPGGDEGPIGGGDEGPAGDGGEEGVPGGAAAPSGEVADGGGGELPFTGYPLTTLVLIILALLLLGLLFRAISARRRDATL